MGNLEVITTGQLNLSAEFRASAALSALDHNLAHSTSAMIDSICHDSERKLGLHVSDRIKQRVMQLVDDYRRSLGGKSIASYENVVRAALVIELRRGGHSAPLAKLTERFDSRKAGVYRMLFRISDILQISLPSDHLPLLVTHTMEATLTYLKKHSKFPPSGTGYTETELTNLACELLACVLGNDVLVSARPTMSGAIACCACILQKLGKITLKDCVRANEFTGSEKICYRDFARVKEFILESNKLRQGARRSSNNGLQDMIELIRWRKSRDKIREKINSLGQ